MKKEKENLTRQIRIILLLFMAALILSGATAIPVVEELNYLVKQVSENSFAYPFILHVQFALSITDMQFPFLLYGYDWLAFAHFVIAIAFIGPWQNPVKNKWVVEFGIIACLLIPPYALCFCIFREIPLWWVLIDSSFGVFGIIPLWVCRNKILRLEKLIDEDRLNLIF